MSMESPIEVRLEKIEQQLKLLKMQQRLSHLKPRCKRKKKYLQKSLTSS
jgi:hypothetical protein